MNNHWNRVIYKWWSPIYDRFFNTGAFLRARKDVFQNIPFEKGQCVLFVGIGTGADLALVNYKDLTITAIDYSPDMLRQAKSKFEHTEITFIEMDAQHLLFDDGTFDVVVASLILSVVPNAEQCFSEMKRVLKPNGHLLIFDKFSDEKVSLGKRLLRPAIRLLGTDIGLSFREIFDRHRQDFRIVEDRPVMMNGMYRKIMLLKEVSKFVHM
ncbi:class I SAM-dependent methyltransferase [Chungangia koreensis]|uniref:Class I SAM-dependent methyltransferase n=1 Tax=Chungangia koreensis TaxID=752657 RepID=A0ABV8X4W5_9LACT